MDRRNSGYISTTASQNIAIRWVNDHFQENAYVYHIIATPNFIDVNGTLRDYSPFPQEIKFAALGVIHWNQIIGWHRIANGSVGSLVRNRDYQRTIYRNFFAGGE